ncbi:MAG: hypothetical protein F6K19_07355 [Cyanothece sp. SIO1E1]|nr:hypothetical protein [Cyanothece sp. SIO1E1]
MEDLVKKALHIPPAKYSRGKHWRGTPEAQRRQYSENNGPSQFLYSMTVDDLKKLERDTLLESDVIDKGGGTYHAYKKYSDQVGYAKEKMPIGCVQS